MSRLDYVTIGIVVICIVALIFLVYKTTNLLGNKDQVAQENTDNTDTDSLDTYTYDDYAPDSSITNPSVTDEDLDDEEVSAYEEEKLDEEAKTSTAAAEQTNVERTSGSSSSDGDFLVLAGAFRVKSNAETEASRLRKLGYTNAEVSPFNRGAYATVLVERFSSMSEAQSLTKELKDKHNVEAIVLKKRAQ